MSGDRIFVKGNEAVSMGAIDAGLKGYFGYPITPQNEIPEYMSKHLPEAGGVFVQAESEVASINMVLGAAAAGARTMTSSSGPGMSLMQEGVSYMAGSELPCVLVNMMRGGPGLGDINTAQGDYYQSTRGGGHGDYRTLCLAPSSCQEAYDMTREAFDLAFEHRTPVLIVGDAILGQMKEPLARREPFKPSPGEGKAWRIGQTRTVVSHRLVCPGTVDARVEEVVAGKRHIADLVLPKSSSLADLDTEQLRSALGLRTDSLLTENAAELAHDVAESAAAAADHELAEVGA